MLGVLAAATQNSALGPPPGLTPPQRFDMSTPQKLDAPPASVLRPTAELGAISAWADERGIPELTDYLLSKELRGSSEVGDVGAPGRRLVLNGGSRTSPGREVSFPAGASAAS